MPIILAWDNLEQTILRLEFTDPWTWEDFFLAAQERDQWIASMPHRVDVIANFLISTKLPTGSPLTQTRSSLANHPANMGVLVIVSNSMFIDMMVNTFRKVFARHLGLEIVAVTSFEVAYQQIAQSRV